MPCHLDLLAEFDLSAIEDRLRSDDDSSKSSPVLLFCNDTSYGGNL